MPESVRITVLEVWMAEDGTFGWTVPKPPENMTDKEIYCLLGVLEQIKHHLIVPDAEEVGEK